MRKLITLWLLLISSFSFAQTWEGGLGNTLQRQRADTGYKGYNYRLFAGSGKPVINLTPKEKQDSILNSKLPIGQRGQQLKITTNNTRLYAPVEPLIYGQFIYTNAQKARAFSAGSATQLQIFNSFKRYSHGGSQTDPSGQTQNNTVPGQPLQTNSWSYDTVANRVSSTFNSGSAIGLISTESFDEYVHTVTVGCVTDPSNDNDRIGVVIAFFEDLNDLVPNNAYGLDPSLFNWSINTTSQFIPNQHDLTLFINRDNITQSYFIVYDYRKTTQAIIENGSTLPGLYNTTANWAGNFVDLKIVRSKDTIRVTRSQFSDAPGGKGGLGFPLTVNLSDNPLLNKFRVKCPYGYAAQSQANAVYGNINFSGSANVVYDLRNGATYPFTGSGYVLDPTRNMYNDLGTRFYWRNKTESTFGYILPTSTYDVIVGETP